MRIDTRLEVTVSFRDGEYLPERMTNYQDNSFVPVVYIAHENGTVLVNGPGIGKNGNTLLVDRRDTFKFGDIDPYVLSIILEEFRKYGVEFK